jgi:Contractile injection system tube protein
MGGNSIQILGHPTMSKQVGGNIYWYKPDSLKVKRNIDIKQKNVGNTIAQPTQFVGMGKLELSVTLEIENTGAIEAGRPSVQDRVEGLVKDLYEYKGSEHRPHYVTVKFGQESLLLQLETMEIDYKLYDADGFPYHAEVACKFTSALEVSETGNQSPDMTHGFTIREGDSLPNLCMQVYGDMRYYMAVAEHNKLTNFRELEIGAVLEFPPIDR